LTVKRIGPWSVLKFGAIANVAFLGIGLLVAGVVWFVIDRLNLVDQVCGIATDVGFTRCAVEPGPLFQVLVLLGLLWVVVQTAVLVFLAFLHNLIADLTGGLVFTMVDDTPGSAARGEPAQQRAGQQRRPGAAAPASRGRRDTASESTAAHPSLAPMTARRAAPATRPPRTRPPREGGS